MKTAMLTWQFWALMAAVFAALTAIFAKIGVEGVNSDLATFIRTLVILAIVTLIVSATGQWRGVGAIGTRPLVFLVLSGLATGASWLCYFRALQMGDAARVAPIDKLSVVLVALFATLFLGERLSAAGWLGIAMIAGGTILIATRA